MGRVIILSGPANCGKSQLVMALRIHHPDIEKRMKVIPLYNSRRKSPTEVEGEQYYFRTRFLLENLASQGKLIAWPYRQGNIIGVDPKEVASAASENDTIALVKIASAIGPRLAAHPSLKDIPMSSVFLSPVSINDINSLKAKRENNTPDALRNALHTFMRGRIRPERYLPTNKGMEIERSVSSGFSNIFEELGNAPHFSHILVNPEIMGGEHWLAGVMPEDSAKVFRSFISILRGERPEHSESWPADLFLPGSREDRIRANFRPGRFYIREEE